MLYMEEQGATVSKILIAYLTVPQSRSIHGLWNKWEKEHGPLWLVLRLKLFASLIVNPNLESTGLVASRGKEWKGPMKWVFRLAQRDRAGFRDALVILRLTGVMETKDVNKRDYVQNFAKIAKIPPVLPPEAFVLDLIDFQDRVAAKGAEKVAVERGFETIMPRRDGVKAPFTPYKASFESELSYDDHMNAVMVYCPSILRDHYAFFKCLYSMENLAVYEHYSLGTPVQFAGRCVGLTKDRSMKIRFIYNPFRVLQGSLSRLYSALTEFCRSLPGFFAWDQAEGKRWVHQQLVNGMELSSIDLFSASDFIPLNPQLELLISLFPHLEEDITIFGKVSRLNWGSPFEGTYGGHSIGQGMGVKVSFLAFSLYLYILLRTYVPDERKAVVGDDLVISGFPGSEMGSECSNVLTSCGMILNDQKSILNAQIGEFLGSIIDEEGDLGVFKSTKPLNLLDNPLGVVRTLGLKVGCTLWPRSKKLRRSFSLVACLPEPLGLGLRPNICSRIPVEVLMDLFISPATLPIVDSQVIQEEEYKEEMDKILPYVLPGVALSTTYWIPQRYLRARVLADMNREIQETEERCLLENTSVFDTLEEVAGIKEEFQLMFFDTIELNYHEKEFPADSYPDHPNHISEEVVKTERLVIREEASPIIGWDRSVRPNSRLVVEHQNAVGSGAHGDIDKQVQGDNRCSLFSDEALLEDFEGVDILKKRVSASSKVLVGLTNIGNIREHNSAGVFTLQPVIKQGSQKDYNLFSAPIPTREISLIRRTWNAIKAYFRLPSP